MQGASIVARQEQHLLEQCNAGADEHEVVGDLEPDYAPRSVVECVYEVMPRPVVVLVRIF